MSFQVNHGSDFLSSWDFWGYYPKEVQRLIKRYIILRSWPERIGDHDEMDAASDVFIKDLEDGNGAKRHFENKSFLKRRRIWQTNKNQRKYRRERPIIFYKADDEPNFDPPDKSRSQVEITDNIDEMGQQIELLRREAKKPKKRLREVLIYIHMTQNEGLTQEAAVNRLFQLTGLKISPTGMEKLIANLKRSITYKYRKTS